MGAKKSPKKKKAAPAKGRNAAKKPASKKVQKTDLVPGQSPSGQLLDEPASGQVQKTSLIRLGQSPSGQLLDGGPRKGCIDHIITPVTGCFFFFNSIFFKMNNTTKPASEKVQKTDLVPGQSPSGQLLDEQASEKVQKISLVPGQSPSGQLLDDPALKPLGGPRKGCIDHIITPVTGCFFFFNFIFFVVGITILAIGAVAYSLPETAEAYSGLEESGSNKDFSLSGLREKAIISLMVGGGIVMLVGFLGCCGAGIGNSVLIYMYVMVLGIMVVLQMASLVFIYQNQHQLIEGLQAKLTKMVKEYKAYNNTDDAAMNLIQQFSKCCGVRSGRDYTKSVWYNRTRQRNQRVPLSCCQLKYRPNGTGIPVNPRCQYELFSKDNPFTHQGCNAAIKRNVFSSGVTAVCLMMGVMLGQLMAICGAAIIERHYLDQDLAHKASEFPI